MLATIAFASGVTEQRELAFNSCAAIGYSGRNQESVRKHVEELALLGVPRPAGIPSLYWISPSQVTQADCIHVIGEETSAEVEFFMAPDREGRLFLTVASDHTDRKLESVSVSKAKQICPKVIGDVFWDLEDVRDHWDDLFLQCSCSLSENVPVTSKNREKKRIYGIPCFPYQEACLSTLLPYEDLLALAQKDAPLAGPTAFLSGTVPVIHGMLRYAPAWEVALIDPILGRAIKKYYSVICLEDRDSFR